MGDTIIHEGDVKYRVAKFWLTLSDRAPAPVTVRATTMAMSATAGSDFRAVTRTITFKAGQFKKPVTVRIEPDTDGEGDEQFHLMVRNPSGVTIADDTGIGTIVENDAGTGPVVTTEMFQVGPFNLNPKGQAGDQDERTAAVPRPSGHVGIKGMRFDLVDGSGTSVGHDIAHLHHIVMLDQSRPDSLCPSLPNRFGGTGMERTEMVLSGDYVYETQPSDQWSGLWHIMNQSSSAQTLYLRYEIDYITDFTNAKPVTSYFYDVDGCWGDSEFTVPGGGGPGSIFEKTKTYTAPASGIRVFTGGHVHPGGIDISLAQNATIVCTATGMYMMGMLHSISTCPDPTPVTAGDTIAIRGRYDNENQILGMMGIMLSYVWQP
ncbi:MAG: hypothetical protein JJE46_09990 [Acidimicrobiia bacterium]|nr:hypothetical protein [Acidimicrobiia bacterium]